MSGQTYELKCLNCTVEDYHFAVYQSSLQETKSVAWRVVGVPSRGSKPSVAVIRWKLNYGVAVAEFDTEHHCYEVLKCQTVKTGLLYQVDTKMGDIFDISPKPVRACIPTVACVKNNTHQAVWLGNTIDGHLTEVREVFGGETMTIKEPHELKCSVMCLRNASISEGQILGEAIMLGPIDVPFTDGCTKCTVEAVEVDGLHDLKAKQVF